MDIKRKIETLLEHLSYRHLLQDYEQEKLEIFLRGFAAGHEENPILFKKIGYYLKNKYGIDNILNHWISQVEHYSFERNLNWFYGFQALLKEIKETDLKDLEDKREEINPISIELGNRLTAAEISQCPIKIGDVIQLTDKIGEDYKKTKFYNSKMKNPSWELFYPSKKDFQYIKLFHSGDFSDFCQQEKAEPIYWGNVIRIFSEFTAQIIDIRKRNNKIYLYTHIFEIELEQAILGKEIIYGENILFNKNDEDLSIDLKESFSNYVMGLFADEEFTNKFFSCLIYYITHIGHNKQKWHWINHGRSIAGGFYKIK